MAFPLAMRLAACVAQAILVLLSLQATGPLALPLVLIGADLFVWNFASFAYDVSGDFLWGVLDTATSPFTLTFGLQFVLVFVGRSRQLRWVLVASYVFSSLLASWSIARASPALAPFAFPHPIWASIFLGDVIVVIALVLLLLARHYREVNSPEERRRVRLLLLALPVAGMFGTTDLVHTFVPAIPPLSQVGTLACAFLMVFVALRMRVFGDRVPSSTLLVTPGIALLAVVGYYVVFRLFAASVAMLLLGTWTLTLTEQRGRVLTVRPRQLCVERMFRERLSIELRVAKDGVEHAMRRRQRRDLPDLRKLREVRAKVGHVDLPRVDQRRQGFLLPVGTRRDAVQQDARDRGSPDASVLEAVDSPLERRWVDLGPIAGGRREPLRQADGGVGAREHFNDVHRHSPFLSDLRHARAAIARSVQLTRRNQSRWVDMFSVNIPRS